MADLLTHYVSGRIAGIGIRSRVTAAIFTSGVFLPDVAKQIGTMPGMPYLVEIPSHTPFGVIFVAAGVSQLFAQPLRWTAFWALYFGSLMHLLLDLMKDYLGSGAVFLLHPFSSETFELGLYRSEDVFYLLPANLAILGILWVLGRRRRHLPATM
jgi:hypothetical protein